MKEEDRQSSYYATTAEDYHQAHASVESEHQIALSFLMGMLDHFKIRSILDVGAGTGRALLFFKNQRPDLDVLGVEPVQELREEGHRRGLGSEILVAGNGTDLQFPDAAFDLVCEFGMLHHVKNPDRVVAEMLRVAKKTIFLSDCNNFGQGSLFARSLKQGIDKLGLWKLFNFIQTRGKGYKFSEGDGLYYSYSLFNNLKQIQRQCETVHFLNTKNAGANLYRSAGHLALLGVKG